MTTLTNGVDKHGKGAASRPISLLFPTSRTVAHTLPHRLAKTKQETPPQKEHCWTENVLLLVGGYAPRHRQGRKTLSLIVNPFLERIRAGKEEGMRPARPQREGHLLATVL